MKVLVTGTAGLELLPLQVGGVPDTEANVSVIATVNYQPTVSVEPGITQSVQWYKSYYTKTTPDNPVT